MGVNDIFVFVADAIYDYALAADSLTDEEDEGEEDDDDADRSTDSPSDCTGGDDHHNADNYDAMTPAAKGSRGVTPAPRGLASARSGPTPGRTPGADRFDTTPNSQRSCFCWVPFLGGGAAPK
jgi:hypothetical protein